MGNCQESTIKIDRTVDEYKWVLKAIGLIEYTGPLFNESREVAMPLSPRYCLERIGGCTEFVRGCVPGPESPSRMRNHLMQMLAYCMWRSG